jgi:hypothetical protein
MIRCPFRGDKILIELGGSSPTVISLPGKAGGFFCTQQFGKCGDVRKVFTPAILLRAK